MQLPPALASLDTRPGQQWTAEEVQELKRWFLARSQLQRVWHYAARYLGTGATREDVEEAVGDFYLLLETARQSYRPGGPDFTGYLVHVCFKRHCIHLGNRIRRRQEEEQPLESASEGDLHYRLELADTDLRQDPQRRLDDLAFLEDLAVLLESEQLPARQKQAFVLRFLRGLSYEEIALMMDAPVGSVKGWIHRATLTARAFLRGRGWFGPTEK